LKDNDVSTIRVSGLVKSNSYVEFLTHLLTQVVQTSPHNSKLETGNL